MNQSVNATQMVRNSTPCIASLLSKPKAEIQTLRIFSGAAKAIASPKVRDFVLIQVNHPLLRGKKPGYRFHLLLYNRGMLHGSKISNRNHRAKYMEIKSKHFG